MNKDKSGRNFHDKWKHFSLFLLSGDGVLGKEAQVVLAASS